MPLGSQMNPENLALFEGLVKSGMSTGEIANFVEFRVNDWGKFKLLFDDELLQLIKQNNYRSRISGSIKAGATHHRLHVLGLCKCTANKPKHEKKEKKGILKTCVICGKEFYDTSYYLKKKFCSHFCCHNSTLEEKYGKEKADEMKKAQSLKLKGRIITWKTGWSCKCPNKFELKFIQIISELKLDIRFTGDKSLWLYLTKEMRQEFNKGSINPDFVVEPFDKTRKVIELFGEKWHPKEDEIIKKAIYNKLGIDVLVIWRGISMKEPDKTKQSLINFYLNNPINPRRLSNGRRVLLVDIDGVLACTSEQLAHQYELARNGKFKELQEAYIIASPKAESIKKLNELYDKGDDIVLWTSRHEEDRLLTKKWLRKYGVKYHILLMDKIPADYYIDDRGLKSLEELPDE